MKSSLVILYHREPYDEVVENGKTIYREKKSPNGIVPTLKSFFANADSSTWVAWKQVAEDKQESFDDRVTMEGWSDGPPRPVSDHRASIRRIPLTAERVKDFYYITAKEAIWPILHSFPEHFTDESSDWENFQHINQLFAAAACEEAADDALIWIHDYNLWLTPFYIRQKMPNVKIAFFHHTPFPAADVFNILHWREAIIDSLLCCDLCGFHIPRYVENFVSAARSLRDVKLVERKPVPEAFTPFGTALAEPDMTTKLEYKGRLVNVDAFPVGTNPGYIHEMVNKPSVQKRVAEIRDDLGDNKLIVSAGRVDYVKGAKEMLLCFERLLERRPELCGKVNLIMTAVKAAAGIRVYKTAQSEIEQLVGQINGKYSTLTWNAISLFTEPIPSDDLMALYKTADIAWIPPLRDGLNLVAKEYIAAHGGENGVLVLSEFTGSAVELPDAVLTNPYSDKNMDECIDFALAMPPEEQKRRMANMHRAITRYDVQQWANHMFREANAVDIVESEGERELAIA